MTSEQFVFWLQGFFEISEAKSEAKKIKLDEKQTEMIKRHLSLVFFHEIDPSYSDDPKVQEKMNDIHENSLDKETNNPPAKPIKKPYTPSLNSFDGSSMFPSENNVVYRC